MNAAASKVMTKGTLLSGLFLSLALAVGVAHAAVKGGGGIVFHAKGPMGLKIDGTGPLNVEEVDGKIKLTVPFAKLDTKMEMRNKHMRERMHADKFPMVTFSVERSKLTFPADGQESTGKAVGTLDFHGVSKPLPFTYKAKRSGNTYAVSGDMAFNVGHHGVKEDSLCEMKICAKPDVAVHVDFKVSE
jgi:polyisoprenoid-binding protein YceI